MILNELYFMKKSEKIVAKVITWISHVLIILCIGGLLYFMFRSQEENTFILYTIILLISSISVIDIYQFFKNNSSIGFTFMRFWYRRKKSKKMIIEPVCNPLQKNICEGLYQGNHSLVHIYGYPERGKTTTAFFALEGMFLYGEKKAAAIKKIIFIDCSYQKEQVVAFFEGIDRIKQFDSSVIIIDCIEQMGPSFIEMNKELFNARNNLFILIEDNAHGGTILEHRLDNSVKRYNLNKNVLNTNEDAIEINVINHWDEKTQKIFFLIYLSIQLYTYASVSYICKIACISKRELKNVMRKIRYAKVFFEFPFDNHYIYCTNEFFFKKIPEIYSGNTSFLECLRWCKESNDVNSEGKWLCFIQDENREIQNTAAKERLAIFDKALLNGKFSLLYEALDKVIRFDSLKEEILSYEYGVLSYYVGKHSQAFALFNSYFVFLESGIKEYVMLRVIETAHGCSAADVIEQLENYLEILIKNEGEIHLYAQYWRLHISTEKGEFPIQLFQELCKELRETQIIYHLSLHNEMIKRCYTDIFRCYHILGEKPSKTIVNDFKQFLSSASKNMYDYYVNLYIAANGLHYLDIPETIYENISQSEINKWIEHSKIAYDKALDSGYLDEKSRNAVLVKRAELDLLLVDADVELILKVVYRFLMHSEANHVDVHVAFSQTLIAKIKMIQNPTFTTFSGDMVPICVQEEITFHLTEARSIFEQYGNIYGVFRVDFLSLLFSLYIEKSNIVDKIVDIEQLCNQYPDYKKENRMVQQIKEQNGNGQLTKMFLLWVIKSYPIILQ